MKPGVYTTENTQGGPITDIQREPQERWDGRNRRQFNRKGGRGIMYKSTGTHPPGGSPEGLLKDQVVRRGGGASEEAEQMGYSDGGEQKMPQLSYTLLQVWRLISTPKAGSGIKLYCCFYDQLGCLGLWPAGLPILHNLAHKIH